MFPSVEIINRTKRTLTAQKGGRFISLAPGRHTVGAHEWPFIQRQFKGDVRLAPRVPETRSFDPSRIVPLETPEPTPAPPVDLDEAERLDHEEHLADKAKKTKVEKPEQADDAAGKSKKSKKDKG